MCASDRSLPRLGALAAALLLLCAVTTAAAQQNSREQEQVRRLRQQLQQLQGEQTAQRDAAAKAGAKVDAERAEALARLTVAQAELKRLRGNAGKQAAETAEAARAVEALRAEQAAERVRADELRAQLETAGRDLQTLRGQHAELQRTLARRGAELADLNTGHRYQGQVLEACSASNKALHALGLELLQRYENKGLAEVLAHNEPFVQTRRVQLENLVEAYRDKLMQQSLDKPRYDVFRLQEADSAP
ncbi:conserved exported hypothetical protein [Rubrivivax sp. A210]|uniref:hypothetical protein n=1 Tax=Rubrivivax sp. A210 TaxID=2772301 RepID=UPI001919B908|nr:hypothetical protein [Rubrivivax sp. A210]CAD5373525.1 conserved exported hypothetical protein [Rubrivivax sp. A210]